MKSFEKAEDKIRLICDELRNNTLKPAQDQAKELVKEAEMQAKKIKEEAREKHDKMIKEAKEKIAKEEKVLKSTLEHAYRMALENFKQNVSTKLVRDSWKELFKGEVKNERIVAELLSSLVKGIEKEGIEGDLHAYIPAELKSDDVNALLAKGVRDRLAEKSVLLDGEMDSGVSVKLEDENIKFDFTGDALEKILWPYIYEGFRDKFISSSE